MKKVFAIFAMMAFLLPSLMILIVSAIPVSAETTTITINITVDATLSSPSGGSESTIWQTGVSSGVTYRTVIYFDLSGYAGSTIVYANIDAQVYYTGTNSGGAYHYYMYRDTSSWTASTVKYNTQPSFYATPVSNAGHMDNAHLETWNVTTWAQDVCDGDLTNYGLTLKGEYEQNGYYGYMYSDTNSNSPKPHLDLKYTTVDPDWKIAFTSSFTTETYFKEGISFSQQITTNESVNVVAMNLPSGFSMTNNGTTGNHYINGTIPEYGHSYTIKIKAYGHRNLDNEYVIYQWKNFSSISCDLGTIVKNITTTNENIIQSKVLPNGNNYAGISLCSYASTIRMSLLADSGEEIAASVSYLTYSPYTIQYFTAISLSYSDTVRAIQNDNDGYSSDFFVIYYSGLYSFFSIMHFDENYNIKVDYSYSFYIGATPKHYFDTVIFDLKVNPSSIDYNWALVILYGEDIQGEPAWATGGYDVYYQIFYISSVNDHFVSNVTPRRHIENAGTNDNGKGYCGGAIFFSGSQPNMFTIFYSYGALSYMTSVIFIEHTLAEISANLNSIVDSSILASNEHIQIASPANKSIQTDSLVTVGSLSDRYPAFIWINFIDEGGSGNKGNSTTEVFQQRFEQTELGVTIFYDIVYLETVDFNNTGCYVLMDLQGNKVYGIDNQTRIILASSKAFDDEGFNHFNIGFYNVSCSLDGKTTVEIYHRLYGNHSLVTNFHVHKKFMYNVTGIDFTTENQWWYHYNPPSIRTISANDCQAEISFSGSNHIVRVESGEILDTNVTINGNWELVQIVESDWGTFNGTWVWITDVDSRFYLNDRGETVSILMSLIWLIIVFLPAIALNLVIPKIGFIGGIILMTVILGLSMPNFFFITIITLIGCGFIFIRGD